LKKRARCIKEENSKHSKDEEGGNSWGGVIEWVGLLKARYNLGKRKQSSTKRKIDDEGKVRQRLVRNGRKEWGNKSVLKIPAVEGSEGSHVEGSAYFTQCARKAQTAGKRGGCVPRKGGKGHSTNLGGRITRPISKEEEERSMSGLSEKTNLGRQLAIGLEQEELQQKGGKCTNII